MDKKSFDWRKGVAWKRYKKVLVTGMGGGCDVFSAFALAKELRTMKVLASDCELLFGNCTGQRPALETHKQLAPALYEIEAEKDDEKVEAVILEAGKPYYGTCALEESLRGAGADWEMRGPLLSVVMERKLSDKWRTVEAVTKHNVSHLVEAWSGQSIDLVIAIDNGGDSITGGVDYHDSVRLARDVQVRHALEAFAGHYYHVVFGPCSDGESTEEDMMEAVQAPGMRVMFKGAYRMSAAFVESLAKPCAVLGRTRTPAIIKLAHDLYHAGYDDKLIQKTIVPRALKPCVDLRLLFSVWVFSKL